MEIKSEEPPCVGQWFSFWIVGAKGKTKIEARVDAKRTYATECLDHPCHELIQIPDRTENRMLRISATDSAGTTCEKRFTIQVGKPRPELTALTPENVAAGDVARFPTMTGWFAPTLLAKLLLKVIISDVFGQYADRRLISAALDRVSAKGLRVRTDISRLTKDETGAVWFDYVSDLGDGFDATYAIAYLLAQPELRGRATEIRCCRAATWSSWEATRSTRRRRATLTPSRCACRTAWRSRTKAEKSIRSSCSFPATMIGRRPRELRQCCAAGASASRRWPVAPTSGSQAGKEAHEADHRAGARHGPAPGRLFRGDRESDAARRKHHSLQRGARLVQGRRAKRSFPNLTYVSRIADHAKDEHGNKKDLENSLVLSGDSHHYAHYVGGGAHYITSGGGGAFCTARWN